MEFCATVIHVGNLCAGEASYGSDLRRPKEFANFIRLCLTAVFLAMRQQLFVPSARGSRREFVKIFAQISAWFGVCAPISRYFVGEVQAQSSGLAGDFNVSLADAPFTALQNLQGSVRVEVPNGSGITALTAQSGNANPSVIITRVAISGGTQFATLGQRCTHQGNAVDPKVAGQDYLRCPLHGSRYNPTTGAVVLGPAVNALTPFQTVFNGTPTPGTLQIRIAGIGYTFVGSNVTSTQGPRVRLQFPTRSLSNYEVRFRDSITGTQSVLPFFTTQNGTTTVNQIAGNGQVLSAYVTPPAQVGFYVIAAKP